MDTGEIKLFSPKECLEIVANSLNMEKSKFKLKTYRVERASNDLVGFMGEYYKLKICLQDKYTEEQHYFVKSVPISNEFHKQECERKRFFDKETHIYTEVLPNLQRYAALQLFPKCYYTRPDLIVLQDLSISKNVFRQLPASEFTMTQRKVVLKNLAVLHAASIAWELKEKINLGEKFKDTLFELQLSMNNEWYVTGIKSILFLARMSERYEQPEVKQLVEERLHDILCRAQELTEPSAEFRNVICHRDSWERNIFFEFAGASEPVGCRFVDFQLTRYSPPAIDVLFFLYINTDAKQRKLITDECLDYYYQSLQEVLVDKSQITKANFLKDCQRARLVFLILWAICTPLLKMPDGLSNKMRAEEQEKFDFYMNSQRDELFKRVMMLEPSYREIIMEPVDELLDYLLQISNK